MTGNKMVKNGHSWEEFVDYAKTHTKREIAEHFGYSKDYTYVILTKNNIPYRNGRTYSVETVNMISEYAKTHTMKEISEEFGISTVTLLSLKKEFGFTCLKRRHKSEFGDRNSMIKVLGKHFAYEAIGKVFGMSKQRVEQIVNGGEDD